MKKEFNVRFGVINDDTVVKLHKDGGIVEMQWKDLVEESKGNGKTYVSYWKRITNLKTGEVSFEKL